MDSIQLTGIRCYGYTGFLPEEQVLGQWFEVDLIIATVKHLVKTAKFALVEKLASAIADAILESESVQQVRVQLSKPAAPIPDFGGKIAIDITRRRD
ncbi:MAG: dihydroneopterin aldolase [Cyanobacteria bacterium SW_6_48_11]|nr:MAG: dihydroneopterin aldolase [Cyanobacteria bacterium SW_6_48_11]